MMRAWMVAGAVVVAGAAAAFAYGCGETSFGSCADNGMCPPDGGTDAGQLTPPGDATTDGSSSGGSSPDAGDGGPPCDQTAAPHDNACVLAAGDGIFVSPGGVDSNAGTMASPVATLGHALELAASGSKRVFACGSAGSYTESLVVDGTRDGVAVYGGLDCSTPTWTYDGSKLATVAPSAQGYALHVAGLTAGVTFADFAFKAKAGVQPGESSIAVFVANSSNVVFRRSTFTALDGVAGVDQPAVPPFDAGAPNGQPGTADAGGAETVNACGMGIVSIGGAGAPPAGGGANGENGSPGPANQGTSVSCANSSIGGGAGVNGDAGTPGQGARAWADLTDKGWTPKAGSIGGVGGVGQGGGGGGTSGKGSIGGGGAGGAGGCGGGGGLAGSGGGSSITLLCVGSAVDLEGCRLLTSLAGRGGNGGAGQVGQAPGLGGLVQVAGTCLGGNGGYGGGGGGGGGGAGGLSVGILWTGATPPTVDGAQVTEATTLPNIDFRDAGSAGTGGAAGPGGSAAVAGQFAGNAGTAGIAGVAQAVLQLP